MSRPNSGAMTSSTSKKREDDVEAPALPELPERVRRDHRDRAVGEVEDAGRRVGHDETHRDQGIDAPGHQAGDQEALECSHLLSGLLGAAGTCRRSGIRLVGPEIGGSAMRWNLPPLNSPQDVAVHALALRARRLRRDHAVGVEVLDLVKCRQDASCGSACSRVLACRTGTSGPPPTRTSRRGSAADPGRSAGTTPGTARAPGCSAASSGLKNSAYSL